MPALALKCELRAYNDKPLCGSLLIICSMVALLAAQDRYLHILQRTYPLHFSNLTSLLQHLKGLCSRMHPRPIVRLLPCKTFIHPGAWYQKHDGGQHIIYNLLASSVNYLLHNHYHIVQLYIGSSNFMLTSCLLGEHFGKVTRYCCTVTTRQLLVYGNQAPPMLKRPWP